jgi:hypothetical protein
MSEASPDPRAALPLAALALLVGGLAIMLAALDILVIDPQRLRAPRAVVFAAGLALALAGALLALARAGVSQHAPRYLFVVGLLLTTFTATAIWSALSQHDVTVLIGPITWRGRGADAFGTTMAALAAFVMGAICAWCWRLWWRALRSS